MRFFQSLTLLALSGLGLASPVDTSSSAVEARHWPGPWGYGQCLRKEDAQELVDAYVRMIRGWKDEDAKYLAESFTDWSDSINILAGKPLGTVTFPSKAAFVKKQQVAPDNLPIEVTHQGPIDCDEISIIWSMTFGAAQKPVRGETILTATKEAGYWQISRIDVEFNSIAYLLNIGGTYTMPSSSA